jgi:uncharacterized cupin superfamily protein
MASVNNPEFDERRAGRGFESMRARLGTQAGAEKLGLSLWEVPPGIAAYPYHWHVVEEEMVVVLDGHPVLRTPEGERRLEPGDVVAFLVGERGAHQLWNDSGDETVRFLSFSSWTNGPEICFYPDSNKVGVYSDEVYELYKRDSAVDYWLDEVPPTGAGSSSA